MTPELDAIRERASRATKGPWTVEEEIDGYRAGRRTVVKAGGPQAWGAARKRVVTVDQTRAHHDVDAEANIEFIAHARTDIPMLVSLVDRLEAELAQTHQQLTARENTMRGVARFLTHLADRRPSEVAMAAVEVGPEAWPLLVACIVCGSPERAWCTGLAADGNNIGQVHPERRMDATTTPASGQLPEPTLHRCREADCCDPPDDGSWGVQSHEWDDRLGRES